MASELSSIFRLPIEKMKKGEEEEGSGKKVDKMEKKTAVEWQYMDKRTRHYVSEKVKETYDVV